MAIADSFGDDGVGGALAIVVIVTVAIVIIIVVAIVAGAAATRIVVVHVTALFGTLQAIVILLGDMTTSRETITQIGTTTTLVACPTRITRKHRKHCLVMVRLLSHFLQVLERTEDLLVQHITLLTCVIGRSHVSRAPHHRHAIHFLSYLNYDLISQ